MRVILILILIFSCFIYFILFYFKFFNFAFIYLIFWQKKKKIDEIYLHFYLQPRKSPKRLWRGPR